MDWRGEGKGLSHWGKKDKKKSWGRGKARASLNSCKENGRKNEKEGRLCISGRDTSLREKEEKAGSGSSHRG